MHYTLQVHVCEIVNSLLNSAYGCVIFVIEIQLINTYAYGCLWCAGADLL